VAAFRRRATGSGVVAGGVALAGLAVLHEDVPRLFDELTAGGPLVLVVASALAGVVTLVLVLRTERFGIARLTSAAAVACLIAAWAVAQYPDMLPGRLTIADAAAGDATLQAVMISTGVAVVILGPSLWLLYRLVLGGTLDQEYEPLDQRFRPIQAGGDEDAPARGGSR
jgi:cytochrome d ubiquinol oxidase subunit II